MKSNKLVNWFLAGFSLLTFLAFVGATTGTLAWYAYVTRASMAYQGVSITKTAQLQIGIRDDAVHKIVFDNDTLIANNCEPHDESNIVWAKTGADLNQKIISGYLSGTDSDSYVNQLLPVTSKVRKRDSVDALTLYEHPRNGEPEQGIAVPEKSVITIPLAFRILDNENHYTAGTKIWIGRMEAIKATTTGADDVAPAIRMFVTNPDDPTNCSLVNPSAANDGVTTVAGLLDLNNDGYFDNGLHDAYEEPKELLYGSYTGTPAYTNPALAEDSDFDGDVNSLTTAEKISGGTTFYAKHRKGVKTITNWDDLTLGEAEYYGIGTMQPVRDTSGHYGDSGRAVSVTDDTTKIAKVDLTIFLEGWDHAVINQAIGCLFNLGITFEIDRM